MTPIPTASARAADASRRDEPVWAQRQWPPLPRLRGAVEAEVCVVGLGGSGLAAIGELLDLGVGVVGVDAGTVGGGAAGRNGGFLLAGTAAFHHRAETVLGIDRAAALYRLTLDELDRIWLETPQAVRRTGSLRIASSDEEVDDCRAQLASLREAGLPAAPYKGPEGVGLRFPLDGAMQPLLRCRLLASQARRRRAPLFEYSPATEITGSRVVTREGQVRCNSVIVAVDGMLERLLPELGGRVRTARAQMLATAPAFEIDVTQPVYARWGREYWQQLADRRIALGGFRDVGGDDEWTDQAHPTTPVQRALETFLRTGLGVRAPVTHRWAGLIAFTDDKLPIVEEVRDGVWAAGAYSGTGNVLGAICGRALARRVSGRRSALDGILLDGAASSVGSRAT